MVRNGDKERRFDSDSDIDSDSETDTDTESVGTNPQVIPKRGLEPGVFASSKWNAQAEPRICGSSKCFTRRR